MMIDSDLAISIKITRYKHCNFVMAAQAEHSMRLEAISEIIVIREIDRIEKEVVLIVMTVYY